MGNFFKVLENKGKDFEIDFNINELRWNKDGLMPVIAQQHDTNEVLMLAWMNQQALIITLQEQKVCYFSRSRNRLWRKGEESGHYQILRDLQLDCDGDAILVKVEQIGVACHTGRDNCFYNSLKFDKIKINSDIKIEPR